jgi:hypothetical protein
MSEPSPCYGCTERFTACWGQCPKDARKEYGYKAWKAKMDVEKQADKLRISIAQTAAKRRSKWAYIKKGKLKTF